MPAVKTEKIESPGILGDESNSSLTSSRPNSDQHQRQYVLERGARIHENSLPYRQPGPHQQAPQPQYHPAVLAQAIGQATHEALLGTRNAVYLCALQEITEVRSVAATYQRQAMQFYKELTDARDAYAELLSKTKALVCQQEGHTEIHGRRREPPSSSVSPLVQPTPGPNARISEPTPALPPLTVHINSAPSQPVAPAITQVIVPQMVMTTQDFGPAARPTTMPTNLATSAGSVVPSPDPGPTSVPPMNEFYGPVALPGGFRIIPHVGPWETTPWTRPSDLRLEVFWLKGDWFGRGYSNGTFVTDRNGNHLKHLMKGIRRTARKIWTELARRPGSWVAATFNKNGLAFLENYVGTIEAIYPCLKLCAGHWKAKQIGISAYSHWYKNRSRYLDGSVAV